MKKRLLHIASEITVMVILYGILLHRLAGTNSIAGIFSPGLHQPWYFPFVVVLFITCRLYVVLLPGILLARIATAWLNRRRTPSRKA